MTIAGKTVLVTGGSRGLGAELGLEFARRGARVVLVGRDPDTLEAAVNRIRAVGGEAHGIVADVGDKEAVYPLAGSAAALVGSLDIVVHNASTLGPVPLRSLVDSDCEDLGRVLDVNLIGPFRLTKAIVGSMVVRGSGTVVAISSDAATTAYPNWGAYGVSKAALDHLIRTWAVELVGSGVQFLSVDPGEMDTQMHADAMPEADRSTLASPADVAQRIVELLAKDDPK